MNPPFHVFVAIDEGYSRQLRVLWASLFAQHAAGSLCLHVLHSGLAAEREAELNDWAKQQGHASHFHCIPPARTLSLPVNESFPSPVQFHRLFIDEYVPADVSRVLYLDADTLVCRDLTPLMEFDLRGCAVGGVEDLDAAAACQRLGLEPAGGYFNSGVLLIDPRAWRAMDVPGRVREYLAAHRDNPAYWQYPDQDSLNVALAGNWTPLPLEWNLFVWLRMFPPVQLSPARCIALRDPGILHFTGSEKPWLARSVPPYQQRYLRMAKQAGVRFPGFCSPMAWWVRRRQKQKVVVQRRRHNTAGLGEDF